MCEWRSPGMSLQLVKSILEGGAGSLAWDGWIAEQEERAERVERYRDYADGHHEAKLTQEMADLLRVKFNPNAAAPFNLNHCDTILSAMVDRLKLESIRADNDAATDWAAELLRANRLDEIQMGVYEAACRDGDSYLMVSWDNATGQIRLTEEDAFDGVEGVIVKFAPDRKTVLFALKIWVESVVVTESDKYALRDDVRINMYYPERVEKWIAIGGKALQKFEVEGEAWPAPWTDATGQPLGVPFHPFRNRATRYNAEGKSELDDVLPLQDALNRTLVSMVYSSELSAFQIRYSIGVEPPAALSPGMWVKVAAKDSAGKAIIPKQEDAAGLNAIRFGTLEQAQLAPFINQATFLIDQMYTIARTPRQDEAGSNASGEAMKQREIGLIGKVERAHVNFGGAWESTIAQAARVQATYGDAPPAAASWRSVWKPAALRNDTEVVDNLLKIADRIDPETLLEELAPVFGWNQDKIAQILARRGTEEAARLARITGIVPRRQSA